MEYRRRRNRSASRGGYTSSRYSRQRSEQGGSFFSLFLLIIMATGLVYLLVATPVGSMLFGNVFGRRSRPAPTPDANPSLTPAAPFEAAQQTPSHDNTLLAESCTLPPLELYALQLGAFDSAGNAQGLISSLRSLGAAGYALASDPGVKILASCYSTESAANSVSQRLTEQGYECAVHPISCSGAVLNVEAPEADLSAIKAAVELARNLIDMLNDEVIRFDSEERSVEYGIAVANEMLESVRSVRAALSGINDPSGAVKLIEDHFIELTGCFTRFTSAPTGNRVELSGKLKHLQLEVIDRYCALCSKLGGVVGQ